MTYTGDAVKGLLDIIWIESFHFKLAKQYPELLRLGAKLVQEDFSYYKRMMVE